MSILRGHLAPDDRTEGGRPGRRRSLEGAAGASYPSAMFSEMARVFAEALSRSGGLGRRRPGGAGRRRVYSRRPGVCVRGPDLSDGRPLFLFELLADAQKLFQRRLEVLDDLQGQDLGLGEVLGVFEALVFQPEDVQVRLVPLHKLVVREGPEPLVLPPLVPVLGVVALDELPEVLRPEGIGLEGEMLVRPQIVDPEPLGPGGLARLFSVEEEDVGLDALGVKYAGGKSEEGVDVAVVK